MEIGESAAEGAIRETLEEANAEVEVQSPFAQLDIPLIGQVSISILKMTSTIYELRQIVMTLVHCVADVHDFFGEAENSPLFTRSRIIRMSAL